ncbi:MAG: gliding motility protein GldM [Flavobacterium sp.]|nr:MAG: gliding motility protein GldM [Flavobacterium sp.]
MAGGKQTPRQKMINLMYLVFIAMLALNMSKEVLSAFGLMNEKLEASNVDATTRNEAFLSGLAEKAKENEKQYGQLKQNADQVKALADDLNGYLASLKAEMLKGVENPKDYEVMDKGDFLDNKFFTGDKVSKDGEAFLAKIAAFRDGVAKIVPNVAASVKSKFATTPVKNRDGIAIDWLDYHYKGFPMVASLTKLTQLQADVKTTESEVLAQMLQGNLASQVSMTNYQAIVVLDKNAYFQGENVTGKVVLGRYDENIKPTSFNGPGKIENGQAVINMTAGAIGEQTIAGQFTFMENGENVPLKFAGKYVVVPRPNSATISADKMNSVYRGVENPMTISFAGVSDNNVTVSAPGLRKGSRPGQYMWNVTGLSGTSAMVNVTAKLPDGKTVSDKKPFNIREIPRPAPTLRGMSGSGKGNKNDLASSTVKVEFPDFVFDVQTTVQSFELYVPGNAAIVVSGDRFSDAAKKAIAKATRGDVITIMNIKTKLVGAPGYNMKGSSSFSWEVQ